MAKYQNYMEIVAEETLNSIQSSLDCCTCEACRNDIMACALNELPTKYIASREGQVYSKMEILTVQYKADVIAALLHAAKIVKENPRH